MSDIIGVSSQELTNTASKIDSTNTKLKQNLSECAKKVNKLQSTWQSKKKF